MGQSYLKNAALLTGADVQLRLAGMGLRIYLANALGGEGMGLYQLVLAVYALFVTLATAGVSVAATRLMAEELARSRAQARGMLVRLAGTGLLLGAAAMAAQYGLAGAAARWWLGDVRAALAWRQSALPCSGRWGWAKRCRPSCGRKNPAGSGRKARRIGIVLDTGGRIEYNTMDIMAEQAHGALDPVAGNAGKNGCGQIPPRCKRGFL